MELHNKGLQKFRKLTNADASYSVNFKNLSVERAYKKWSRIITNKMCQCFSKRKANANCLINPTIVKRLIGIRRLLLVLSKKRRRERQALKCQIKTINEIIIEEFRKYNCNIIKS